MVGQFNKLPSCVRVRAAYGGEIYLGRIPLMVEQTTSQTNTNLVKGEDTVELSRNEFNHSSNQSNLRKGLKFTLRGVALLTATFGSWSALGGYSDIVGNSMNPEIDNGDSIICLPHIWDRVPARFSKIVFEVSCPVNDSIWSFTPSYIKRIIGLPGEEIEYRSGNLLINGSRIIEPFDTAGVTRDFGPLRIPEGEVFVVGDNRSTSTDSRVLGPVSIRSIESTVLLELPFGEPDLEATATSQILDRDPVARSEVATSSLIESFMSHDEAEVFSRFDQPRFNVISTAILNDSISDIEVLDFGSYIAKDPNFISSLNFYLAKMRVTAVEHASHDSECAYRLVLNRLDQISCGLPIEQ